MRTIALATLCALAVLPAQAQQVDRIKASGANAAGACAGSLEMIGQYLNKSQNPDPQRIADAQQARNFFADLPLYPQAEISAAANAFIALMMGRIDRARTVGERQAVQREIVEISTKCSASVNAEIQARMRANAAAAAPPAVAGTVQPYVAPPATVQPYVQQPIVTQPYTTQPLLLDPVVPAQ